MRDAAAFQLGHFAAESLFRKVYELEKKSSPTHCSCTKRKGFPAIDALSSLQCVACFWMPAAGTELGACFNIGKKSTQKVRAKIAALLSPSKDSSASKR